MKTTVVNIKDCPEGWEENPEYVYVGRVGSFANVYGNKHRIGICFVCNRDHDRYEAVRLHAEEVRKKYSKDMEYRCIVGQLRGKHLVCFCKKSNVEVPCHADVYVELLES